MRRLVSDGLNEYEIVSLHEIQEGDRLREFSDQAAAAGFLNRFIFVSNAMTNLRAALWEKGAGIGVSMLEDRDVIDGLSRHLTAGSIRIVERRLYDYGGGGVVPSKKEKPQKKKKKPIVPPGEKKEEKTAYVSLTIDDPKIAVVKKSYQTNQKKLKVTVKTFEQGTTSALKFDGEITLEATAGADKIAVYDEADVKKTLPLKITGADLKSTMNFFVEGLKGSETKDDVTLKATIKQAGKIKVGTPSSAEDKLSCADLTLVSADNLFAPGLEKLELAYDIFQLENETVFLEIESDTFTGKKVFKRELTAAEKATGKGKKLEWDGKANQGALNNKFIPPIHSPYKAILRVEKKANLHAQLKEEKETKVEVKKIDLTVDAPGNKVIMNNPEKKVLVTGKVFLKKKAGGEGVTPVEIEVTYTFSDDASNMTAAQSFVYSGTKTLGKKGDAAAIYWEDHPDNDSSSSDGYKTKCKAKTIATAGADQGVAKIWFKPSGAGGNKYKVKGEVFAADGTTSLASKESAEFVIWRKITLSPYEMSGQTHVSTQGTDAIMAGYYTADTFVEYKLGTVNNVTAANSVKYIGLWNHGSTSQLNWGTHSAKVAAETPTAAETTAANGPAGPARNAARAAIQTKANAWRDRINTAYTSGLNNWASDAGVPVNSIVSIQFEHPKYSAAAPNADSATSEWGAFPWLRITVEGRSIHPDARWINGQGLSYGQRAYITAGMSNARTQVAIAHEAGHETKNQFKRKTFGAGDHTAGAGLMDPTGSQSSFTAGEKDILKGKR